MSSKAEERWQRLAAMGAKGEIPTPEGEARMSAVILEVAEPLLKQYAETPRKVPNCPGNRTRLLGNDVATCGED